MAAADFLDSPLGSCAAHDLLRRPETRFQARASPPSAGVSQRSPIKVTGARRMILGQGHTGVEPDHVISDMDAVLSGRRRIAELPGYPRARDTSLAGFSGCPPQGLSSSRAERGPVGRA